jgi:hypothetical protein
MICYMLRSQMCIVNILLFLVPRIRSRRLHIYENGIRGRQSDLHYQTQESQAPLHGMREPGSAQGIFAEKVSHGAHRINYDLHV